MNSSSFLDCCREPRLVRIRTLSESSHDLAALQRCTSCAAYWLYRFHEYTDWASGVDDLTSWFTRLTDEEGTRILGAAEHEQTDLSFVRRRTSWLNDRDGVRRVKGAPHQPWS
ncbi:hypothetical protein ACFYTQ_30855 [Nocardia sp. NPDC004068]|uniref:hypothetical protein n=1 Tax=Nocardia sp. NPDC004068 TaxID=3364303 RepID=UPI0036A4F1D5